MTNYKKLTEDIVKETIQNTHFNNSEFLLVFFNRKWNESFFNEVKAIIKKYDSSK